MRKSPPSIRWILLFLALAACGPALPDDEIPPPPATPPAVEPTDTPVPYEYQVPQQLSDGWAVGDLRKERVDVAPITQGLSDIRGGKIPKMHSLLILRHGKLLLEEYFNGFTGKSFHPLFSCTKSVFSTVYGIAQDQGLLSVDEKISDLYPDAAAKGWGQEKQDITIASILSMTSGLACDNGDGGDSSCGMAMSQSKDWLAFCFASRVAHPAGTVWAYNGWCLTLVAKLIAQKSGMSFPDYAQKVLLGPLGIPDATWVPGPEGVNRVDYGLAWKARDMAKLGQLYLDGGQWKGKQIVSKSWVKAATALHCEPGTAFGHSYGYLWHLKDMKYKGKPVRIFFANGYQGQAVFVSPEAGLVCVMTAASDDNMIYSMEERFFEEKILGSFK